MALTMSEQRRLDELRERLDDLRSFLNESILPEEAPLEFWHPYLDAIKATLGSAIGANAASINSRRSGWVDLLGLGRNHKGINRHHHRTRRGRRRLAEAVQLPARIGVEVGFAA